MMFSKLLVPVALAASAMAQTFSINTPVSSSVIAARLPFTQHASISPRQLLDTSTWTVADLTVAVARPVP
jgi:hypothetical protein